MNTGLKFRDRNSFKAVRQYGKFEKRFECSSELTDNEYIRKVYIGDISAGSGEAEIDLVMNDDLFTKC